MAGFLGFLCVCVPFENLLPIVSIILHDFIYKKIFFFLILTQL